MSQMKHTDGNRRNGYDKEQFAESLQAICGNPGALTPAFIDDLLTADEEEAAALFSLARETRRRVFGDKIFLYGFVYYSTYCENDCHFCYYRKANRIERYRKEPREVVETAARLIESGVHLIDLTSGEDAKLRREGHSALAEMVAGIRRHADVGIMVSPGVVDTDTIRMLADAGADFFALYQETHDRALFENLRSGQDYNLRMEAKVQARAAGMLVEEGILSGVGESAESLVHSLQEMGRIGASQVRAMSFEPQEGTPMNGAERGARRRELVLLAIMRILYPHAFIPATLDVDGIAGLAPRLDAGANVVTSIIAPMEGYRGVAQSVQDVDDGGRTARVARGILERMGLHTATHEEFRSAVDALKRRSGGT
ncbi:MAG: methylornithine synthase PylB [Clostridiales Family XIII bacterium]|nr:methylornithine synthase PylB [Clostridiales Family XIII bacterium]